MSFYIKVFAGKITNGQFTGTGEIYDNINKYIRKGFFKKSKLNDVNGTSINYDTKDYKILQLNGNFVNDIITGSVNQIEYNGEETLDSIITNNLIVSASKKECTYINGLLVSVNSETPINISITCTKNLTNFTNFVINEV